MILKIFINEYYSNGCEEHSITDTRQGGLSKSIVSFVTIVRKAMSNSSGVYLVQPCGG